MLWINDNEKKERCQDLWNAEHISASFDNKKKNVLIFSSRGTTLNLSCIDIVRKKYFWDSTMKVSL